MRPRVRSRAGNGGQSQSRFQSDGGLSRLRFDRQLRFAVARIRSVRELGRQNVSRFIGRALFNGGSFVGFDWEKIGFGLRFCLRAVVLAVLNGYSRTR